MLLDAFEVVAGAPASREQVERCHGTGYLDRLEALEVATMLDPDTVASESSYEAALLAVGCTLDAVDRGGFALVRPPGHHALPDRAMGFCLVDNVAVAARYAQAELGIERVAIVDWDVHHGNGTQDIFWQDGSVFFASLHQWPFYPGTGGPGEQGPTLVNLPLPAGTGDAGYLAAWADVERAVTSFQPELLIVSARFASSWKPSAVTRICASGSSSCASKPAETSTSSGAKRATAGSTVCSNARR